MASELRNLSLSLYYRAWQIALQRGYFINQVNVPLTSLAAVANEVPANTYEVKNSYPWVFMDEHMRPWPSGVAVRVNGVLQDPSTYTVDYLNARVSFNSAPPSGATVRADLRVFTINVVDGYPEAEKLEQMKLPVVATDVPLKFGRPYGIGSHLQFRTRICTVDVLARNKGERDDLEDFYTRDMAHVYLVDFTSHQPLGRNNNLDPAFSFADQAVRPLAQMVKPKSESLNPRPGGSSKERYRSLVTFEVENVS